METKEYKEKYFDEILKKIQYKIDEKEFNKNLKKFQKIDLKYYDMIITKDKIKDILKFYQEKEVYDLPNKEYIAVLDGNPNEVFSLCIEAIRYNINLKICIDDFCVAQNMFLVDLMKNIFGKKINISLLNLVNDNELIEYSKNVYKTIFISTSQRYEELKEKIKNNVFYPYNLIDIFYEDEKFEDVIDYIYKYSEVNHYQIDIYEDLNFLDAIRLINKDSYKFISIILTDDKKHSRIFKEKIDSKYVFVNTNPFDKVKFELDINLMK